MANPAPPTTPDTATEVNDLPGLSQNEVQQRIEAGQTNNYRARVSRRYIDIVKDNLLNLFNIVLGSLLMIVIFFQDYATAFFAGFSVVTNTFLGMIQEINAKRKLDQLATLSEQQVRVLRDDAWQDIPMRQVVLDEVIAIEPGSRFAVDGVVLRSDAMEVDESLLTGESDAIFKQPDDEVLSGSFCIAGTGIYRATRVGPDSNINQLSTLAKQYKRTLTPTQNKIAAIVEITVLIMFVFVPMLFIGDLIVTQPPLELLQAVRNAVVFVTSLVPQGLILVAILSLTIGAVKISRHQTLVQRVNAVESLANASVLCFDKTGTLTENRLAVTEVIPLNRTPPQAIYDHLNTYLSNLGHLNRTAGAVYQYLQDHKLSQHTQAKEREIPFTSGRKWGGVMLADGYTLLLGAPERILPENNAHQSAIAYANELSAQGMRVLAFAEMPHPPDESVTQLDDPDIRPIALIVLSDQIRHDIRQTLQAFRDEGIELKVISGDNPETVRAIARESGMVIRGSFTGAQLDAMEDSEIEYAVREANVFARIEPHTKRRLVAAMQSQGGYVAMVGDGVNDVPALKQADLAIVMNDGTQISKDVADIVLLNNAMSTLPRAFHEGKEITQTIFGTMKLFMIKNAYTVLSFIFVMFMGLPFPITPIQISWVTFGTVNIPATLIAFGFIRPKPMTQFRRDVLDYIITVGFMGSVMVAALYVFTYFSYGRDMEVVRSAITLFVTLFGTLTVWQVQGVEFYEPRSFVRHWKVVAATSVLTTLTILTMYALPDLFEFTPFTWGADAPLLLLITTLVTLGVILISHGMRYRYLLRRLWYLFSPDVRR